VRSGGVVYRILVVVVVLVLGRLLVIHAWRTRPWHRTLCLPELAQKFNGDIPALSRLLTTTRGAGLDVVVLLSEGTAFFHGVGQKWVAATTRMMSMARKPMRRLKRAGSPRLQPFHLESYVCLLLLHKSHARVLMGHFGIDKIYSWSFPATSFDERCANKWNTAMFIDAINTCHKTKKNRLRTPALHIG
jgi:hypothetical protein